MVYASVSEIKDRIEFEAGDFFASTSGSDFDDLISGFEIETRSLIDSHFGDITFSQETKTQSLEPVQGSVIPLEYPVNSISSSGVEYKLISSATWSELDEDRWKYTEHNLILKKYPRNYIPSDRHKRFKPLQSNLQRLTWNGFCEELRVTYDRGFSDIPANVKNAQITMISNALARLRADQSFETIEPGEFDVYLNNKVELTDAVLQKLDNITRPRNTFRVI